MREILFRGKRTIDGEWVYGGIVHQVDWYGFICDRWFIIDGTETEDNDIGPGYLVDPATIGQYTGLKDANGDKVFEGDIIGNDKDKYIVVWRGRTAGYAMKDTKNGRLEYSMEEEVIKRCRVVGNIYNKPTPPAADEINAAIQHFQTGIDQDIFSEPVTSYARAALWALQQEKQRADGKEDDK